MKHSFFQTHTCCKVSGMMLDSFLKYQCKGRDKNPSVIYSGSGPGQTSTDSARPERDPVHGLKACVNFIEIGTYQPVIPFAVTDGRKFRN